jgi:lipid-binding SYLF domain-containing protein
MTFLKQTFVRPWLLVLMLLAPLAQADEYRDTIKMFLDAKAAKPYFETAYGYAVFPKIGKAGVVFVGGAYGEGRVFKDHKYTGDVTMAQTSLGFQLGGQAFSQVIFFENKDDYEDFTQGTYEFGAQASATVITASASAEATTRGPNASASGGQNNAINKGGYYKGMATFIIAKGGLMYEVAVSGQKFTFIPKDVVDQRQPAYREANPHGSDFPDEN